MDKNIIMDLYYGKINPMDMRLEERAAYEEHSRRFLAGMDEFAKRLTPELREEFLRLCEEQMQSEELLHREGFKKGFEIGLGMAFEALYCKKS